jgi:adenylylsulfate kinase
MKDPISPTVVWHHATVTRQRREKLNGHRGAVVWLTGLSGAGKSTIAHGTEELLHRLGCRTFVFDGDNVRHGLCSDLGFTLADRRENMRRVGELAKLFLEAGIISFAAFISPLRADRDMVRSLVPHGEFLEIHCLCPLEICEQRDIKGFYARARRGEIPEFTGISSPYEEPRNPELVLNTNLVSVDESIERVVRLLRERAVIN